MLRDDLLLDAATRLSHFLAEQRGAYHAKKSVEAICGYGRRAAETESLKVDAGRYWPRRLPHASADGGNAFSVAE